MTSRAKFTPLKSLLLAASVVFLLASALPSRGADDASAEDADLAKSILQKADLVRFPAQGFEVGVTINSSGASAPTEVHKYRILSKGNENTIVMSTEPASERGQIMLMKARDLWVFLPSVSQPVRLGLSQRLTGMVANGDLARANFVGDYEPKLLRKETVEGEPTFVLELMAVDRGVPYHRVVLWVHQTSYGPVKAEFYSLSDRLLKTCFYQKYEKMAGRLRPTRLVMQDALRSGEESVLDYADMKPRDLPDKVFTKDYLKRLE